MSIRPLAAHPSRVLSLALLLAFSLAALASLTAEVASARPTRSDAAARTWNVLRKPIDPTQQTLLHFGDRSHWLQPWRAYLETIPADEALAGVGINFFVAPHQAQTYARLLGRAGFRRARVEFGWDSLSYGDETKLENADRQVLVLRALRDHRIRPLILLNANHLGPNPVRRFEVRVAEPARAGTRALVLDAASAGLVVPRLSGLNALDGSKAASMIFTAVSGTTVSLSKALPRDLPPGLYPATTFRYEPFDRPGTERFEHTMQGWLAYVRTVTHLAKSVLGHQRFDVEIWNELSFGSDFLNLSRYYDDIPAWDAYPETTDAIVRRTLEWLRNPANGVSRIGIANGFTTQVPWPSGSTQPRGLTALSKHPYPVRNRFEGPPAVDRFRPLDALGLPGEMIGQTGDRWRDRFIPSYASFFPKYYLTAIQTEHLVRDLSPYTTDIYGTPHGRRVSPPGGRAPKVWLTEIGLDPTGVAPSVLPRAKATATLRSLVSWLNKGAGAVYVFAAGEGVGPWNIVKPRAPGGGSALRAVGRLTRALRGRPARRSRLLRLLSVADRHNRRQFAGDGSLAHPPLYDRDVVAFFPFQVSSRKHVVATYVMTRDVTRSRPVALFRLAIGGLRSRVSVTATDPLSGRAVPVRIVSRRPERLVIQLPLTDSPRLIVLRDRPTAR